MLLSELQSVVVVADKCVGNRATMRPKPLYGYRCERCGVSRLEGKQGFQRALSNRIEIMTANCFQRLGLCWVMSFKPAAPANLDL